MKPKPKYQPYQTVTITKKHGETATVQLLRFADARTKSNITAVYYGVELIFDAQTGKGVNTNYSIQS